MCTCLSVFVCRCPRRMFEQQIPESAGSPNKVTVYLGTFLRPEVHKTNEINWTKWQKQRRGMVHADRLYDWRYEPIRVCLPCSLVPPFFTHLYFRSCGWAEAVWYVVGGGGVSSSHCHHRGEKQKTRMHTDSCKHKHIPLTVSFCCTQTHLPSPALSAALFQRASGFKNK